MRRGVRAILTLTVLTVATLSSLPATAGPARRAVLVVAPGISFERAIRHPVLSDLAAGGGIGLMTTRAREDTPAAALGAVLGGTLDADRPLLLDAVDGAGLEVVLASRDRAPVPDDGLLVTESARPGETVRALLEGAGASPLTVIVSFPAPSAQMRIRGDEVTPLILATGPPEEILDGGGAVEGLTSSSTRRAGVVANVDVAPTILVSMGIAVPDEMDGRPIRTEGGPPGDLHRRYLGARGIRFPVQMIILGVALAGLGASALLLTRDLRAPAVARALGTWGLLAIALPVAAYPAGALPVIGWATAGPLVGVLAAAIVAGGSWLGRREPTLAPALVGGIAVSLLALDAAQGWRAALTPVLGGGPLDGARFFGIGNLWGGILLAGAVLLAAHLSPWGGVAFLGGAGLFAGLPWLGANLGVSATLFAATGVWAALRLRRRFGALEALLAAGVTAAGMALIVVAHRLAGDTHVARAVGGGGLVDTALERLRINLEVTSTVLAAWLVPLLLVAGAVAAWRRWGPLRMLPVWRDACLTLAIGGLVGFLANDTGIAVAGMAFAFLAAAYAYPALWERWTSV